MQIIAYPVSMTGRVFSVIAILILTAGCARPDLVIRDLQVEKPADPAYPYDVRYEFVIENRDYGGNLFVRPTTARGRVYAQGYLSSDGVAKDGDPAGGLLVLPEGELLPVGGQKSVGLGASVDLNRAHPFLLVTVTSQSQTEYTTANNASSRLIDPTPPSDLEQWLIEHPGVKQNLRWQQPGGDVVLYENWDGAMKADLQRDVNGILSGNPTAITDPPPLAHVPANDEAAFTSLTVDTARSIYLMHVARSIVSDHEVPWNLSELNDDALTVLFDSRSLFSWDQNRNAYRVVYGSHGSATPGDPNSVYAFLVDNNLVGDSPAETVHRVLEWSRPMQHYFGDDTAGNYVAHWQYPGVPPVSRIISGTINTDLPDRGLLHYTAGCWGTSAFLSLVLRTVNIPVRHEIFVGHAHPHFLSERTYLSHGDDPYNGHMKTSPWIPMSELPISEARHESWFGGSLSYDEQRNNNGRQVYELTLEYLSGTLVLWHCQDLNANTPRSESKVYNAFKRFYTLQELEAVNLWERLDAKAIELGYCTP